MRASKEMADMPVPAGAFRAWLQRLAPEASAAEVSRSSGLKRSTLTQQLARGKVPESTIVAVCRAYGLNPVDGLADFGSYRDLKRSTDQPTDAELLSQVPLERLLREILGREEARSRGTTPAPSETEDASPELTPTVRGWVEAIDDGALRHRVSVAAGIAPQNYSAQLRANRLSPELAVSTAREAGVGLRNGLVVTGLITPTEAGWAPQAADQAIARQRDAALALLASDRLAEWSRARERLEAVPTERRADP